MVIRDPSLYSADGQKSVHPVIEALEALSLSLDDDQGAQSKEPDKLLDTVKQECDIELARRCFAGKNKAYPILLKSMKMFRKGGDTELFVKALETMCSLCNGQPDLLDADGAEYFMDIMKDENNGENVTRLIVKLVRLNCIKHEKNKCMFVKYDLVRELVRILAANKKSRIIVKGVAYGLSVLTQDDDLRVPFGSAHENAKKIVIEGDALRQLLQICSGKRKRQVLISFVFVCVYLDSENYEFVYVCLFNAFQ